MTQVPADLIPLPQVPREISAEPGAPTVTYNRIYKATLNGQLPAVRCGGRWFLRRADIPGVIDLLGLAPPPMPIAA